MQIREYIIRRLLILPLIVVGTSIIVFTIGRVGGNPIAIYLEHEMTQEEVAELEDRYGLNESLPVQYIAWAGGVLRGDLGYSGVAAAPVIEVMPRRIGATLELAVASAIIAVALGIALGTFAGARRNRLPDHVTRIFAVSGAATPTFW
ncbi:MAG: ABC transporter permease, partial [Acidimicrobiia bacterium]|nr:ABC transporter permease [Acidimicrobiia bacterium]